MATLTKNFFGIVVVLEHSEVDEMAALAAQGGDVSAAIAAKLPGIPAIVLAAVAGYLKLESAAVKLMDQGYGIYLTMPYLAPGLVIPTPRPNVGLPANWVDLGSGQFHTEDNDLVQYRVEQNAARADIVDFVLESGNPRMWRKVLVLRDGEGGQWDITIDPSQGTSSASNALWAYQVKHGQTLSFWKAKQFGINVWVMDFAGLEALQPGSRVTFTWLQD
jgi:hypothetical protein